MLPLGTKVTFETTYQTVESFVMKKYLSGIQAMRDTLTATGEKIYPADEARMTSQLTRLKGVSHKLVVDTNKLMSEIYDADTGIKSTINQLSDKVVLKVTSGGRIVSAELAADPATGTSFKVQADDIAFIANGVMNLSANSLGISSTNFTVDKDTGNVAITGAITTTSLKIDNKANLSVVEDYFSGQSASWVDGEMIANSFIVRQELLEITNNTVGFKINSAMESTGTIKGNQVEATSKIIAPDLYVTSNSYFMRMYGHRIELTDSTQVSSLTADIINQAKWDGTNTSLKAALQGLSNRITALGG